MSSMSPWQCGLHNSKDRDNALFLNERLSDLTITFPYHNISFPAHRLMMAKTTPYFENLFYGPMAIHDQEWKVKDIEVEPEVFKVVLAHCYEIDLLDENLEMTLHVYKLADCYMIDSLKFQCLEHLRDAISNNNDADIQCILKWSTKYGLFDIEDKIFEIWSTKLNLIKGDITDLSNDIHKNISNLLLNLPLEKQKELLCKCEHLDAFYCEESWRHPEDILSCEVLMSIFESSSCKNGCKNEYSILKGCISPRTLIHFIDIKKSSIAPYTLEYPHEFHAYISVIDEVHSQALYECIRDQEYDDDMFLNINLHIPCNQISPESLAMWSSEHIYSLYLSNVDDQSVPWVVNTVMSLNIDYLFLPRSSLSLNSFKSLIVSLESTVKDFHIYICSCNVSKEDWEELNALTKLDIDVRELDDLLHDW